VLRVYGTTAEKFEHDMWEPFIWVGPMWPDFEFQELQLSIDISSNIINIKEYYHKIREARTI